MTVPHTGPYPGRPRARIAPVPGLIGLALETLTAARDAARRYGERQRSLLALAELEDWQLDDLGVTRSEVEAMLRRNGIRRDPIQFYLDRK